MNRALSSALRSEALERVVRLAFQVAIEAPMKQGQHSVMAGVRWESIHALRQEMTAAGFDWPSMRKEVERLEKKMRQENLERWRSEQQALRQYLEKQDARLEDSLREAGE